MYSSFLWHISQPIPYFNYWLILMHICGGNISFDMDQMLIMQLGKGSFVICYNNGCQSQYVCFKTDTTWYKQMEEGIAPHLYTFIHITQTYFQLHHNMWRFLTLIMLSDCIIYVFILTRMLMFFVSYVNTHVNVLCILCEHACYCSLCLMWTRMLMFFVSYVNTHVNVLCVIC